MTSFAEICLYHTCTDCAFDEISVSRIILSIYATDKICRITNPYKMLCMSDFCVDDNMRHGKECNVCVIYV